MSLRWRAALVLSASAIAGCGGGSSMPKSTSPSPSTSAKSTATAGTTTAPAGTVKSADGQFATVIPDGFVNARNRVQRRAIVQYLAIGPVHDGFATNINVVSEPNQGQTNIDMITDMEIAGIKRAEPQAHNFSKVQSLTVDGQPARAIDYYSLPQHRLLRQYQVFVIKGGTIYTITYSALPSSYSDNLASVMQVIDGWHWQT